MAKTRISKSEEREIVFKLLYSKDFRENESLEKIYGCRVMSEIHFTELPNLKLRQMKKSNMTQKIGRFQECRTLPLRFFICLSMKCL